jgi:general secretion pathway protein D
VEFQKAVETDPSSFIAQQELKRTAADDQGGAESATAGGGPGPRCAAGWNRRRVRWNWLRISNVPITLKVTEKSNVIYETSGKLAGINVLFDPDYTPARCASN